MDSPPAFTGVTRLCGECSLCPVSCSVGFAVREKIRDIVRVREIPPEFLA